MSCLHSLCVFSRVPSDNNRGTSEQTCVDKIVNNYLLKYKLIKLVI